MNAAVRIRPEAERDIAAIREVNRDAFGRAASGTDIEATLVDELRRSAAPLVSLVAEADGRIVGHILFSPATLEADPAVPVMALGPMAVAPGRQREGIGSALVRAGIERCRELGSAAIFVLGHANYYPRFGFVPAANFGIDSEYDVPADVFMALELRVGALARLGGRMTYHPAFAAAG